MNYQQASDQVFAEIKFKEMNDLLWVDDLEEVDLLDREELKNAKEEFEYDYLPEELKIEPPNELKKATSLQKIVSEKTKEVGKTFFLSVLLTAPNKAKAGEEVKSEPVRGK